MKKEAATELTLKIEIAEGVIVPNVYRAGTFEHNGQEGVIATSFKGGLYIEIGGRYYILTPSNFLDKVIEFHDTNLDLFTKKGEQGQA